MATTRYHNLDTVFKIATGFTPATAWEVPAPHTLESIIRLICQFAKEGKVAELNQVLTLPTKINRLRNNHDDTTPLCDCAVMVLAWEGDETAVAFLMKHQYANPSKAKKGYAWGGHFALADAIRERDIYALQGYALGLHIDKVNSILQQGNEDLHYDALCGYEAGGHLQTLAKTLKLIALSPSRPLRESIAKKFIERNPTHDINRLLAHARKLTLLMKDANIPYSQALIILTDVEASETKQAFSVAALSLFKQVAQKRLTFFQKRALEELKDYQLTEYMLLDWQGYAPERYFESGKYHAKEYPFTSAHYVALKDLIVTEKLSPRAAIQEINQLSAHEVEQLIERYKTGLRGDELRRSHR